MMLMGKKVLKTSYLFGAVIVAVVFTAFFFYEFSGFGKTSDSVKIEKVQLINSFVGAVLKTNFGDIEIEFSTSTAPLAVSNFVKLANESFYNGTLFHRVTKDFIQGGDPLTKSGDESVYGMGGPGYKFDDEVTPDDKMVRGVVAMANSGPNTNGSQFFIITLKEASWLEGDHTIFAKVTQGMDIVDKISLLQTSKNNLPIKPVVLEKVVLK